MNKRWITFDIETAKITPDGTDLQAHRPLGICAWAIAWQDYAIGNIKTQSFCGTDSQGNITGQMSRDECAGIVDTLQGAIEEGYTLFGHNIVGFDLDILAEESGLHAECAELAMSAVDSCLLAHCLLGYPIGLQAICQGMHLSGKTDGMSGSLAPRMWADGKHDEVLAYVEQDARATLEVALAVEACGRLAWVAKSGRLNTVPIQRWLSVFEAIQLSEPDTSWMTSPIPRSRFIEWMYSQEATR